MDKQGKISFLKSIVTGAVKVSDLRIKKLRLEVLTDFGTAKYFVDNTEVSGEEYRAILNKQKFDLTRDVCEIIIDGISTAHPDYLDISCAQVYDNTPQLFFDRMKENSKLSIPLCVRFCKNPDILRYVEEKISSSPIQTINNP